MISHESAHGPNQADLLLNAATDLVEQRGIPFHLDRYGVSLASIQLANDDLTVAQREFVAGRMEAPQGFRIDVQLIPASRTRAGNVEPARNEVYFSAYHGTTATQWNIMPENGSSRISKLVNSDVKPSTDDRQISREDMIMAIRYYDTALRSLTSLAVICSQAKAAADYTPKPNEVAALQRILAALQRMG